MEQKQSNKDLNLLMYGFDDIKYLYQYLYMDSKNSVIYEDLSGLHRLSMKDNGLTVINNDLNEDQEDGKIISLNVPKLLGIIKYLKENEKWNDIVVERGNKISLMQLGKA